MASTASAFARRDAVTLSWGSGYEKSFGRSIPQPWPDAGAGTGCRSRDRMPEPWPDAGAVAGCRSRGRDRSRGRPSARCARLVGRGRSRFWLASDLGVPRDKPRGGANCEKDLRPNRRANLRGGVEAWRRQDPESMETRSEQPWGHRRMRSLIYAATASAIPCAPPPWSQRRSMCSFVASWTRVPPSLRASERPSLRASVTPSFCDVGPRAQQPTRRAARASHGGREKSRFWLAACGEIQIQSKFDHLADWWGLCRFRGKLRG